MAVKDGAEVWWLHQMAQKHSSFDRLPRRVAERGYPMSKVTSSGYVLQEQL